MDGFTIQQTTFPFVCIIIDDFSTDGEQKRINNYLESNFDVFDENTAYKKETEYAHISFAQHKTNRNCYFVVLHLKYNHYSIKKSKLPYLSEWLDDVDYSALCEGDDYWIDPFKLQKQVSFLDSHPDYGIVRTNVSRLFQINGIIENNFFSSGYRKKMKDTFDDYLINSWFAAPCTWLYRTKYVYQIPPVPDKNKYFSGDLLTLLTILKSSKMKYLSDTTAVYRVLEKSASHYGNYKGSYDFWKTVKNTRVFLAKDIRFFLKMKLWLNCFVMSSYFCLRVNQWKEYKDWFPMMYRDSIKLFCK